MFRGIGVVSFALLLAALAFAFSCGKGGSVREILPGVPETNARTGGAPGAAAEPTASWPSGLPADKPQPWEKLDSAGNVIRESGGNGEHAGADAKLASSINPDTIFTPGAERYLEAGDVSDLDGEASRFASGVAGARSVSYALYRIVMGGGEPGMLAVDANPRTADGGGKSSYYVGLSDYGGGTWKWNGPFFDSHVRIPYPAGDFTSEIGNTFVAVAAFDGSRFDLVGIGVNAKDASDSTPPPAPAAPSLTPVPGGLVVEWPDAAAGDLGGYRLYHSGAIFTQSTDGNVRSIDYVLAQPRIILPADHEEWVGITALDISGNESGLSPLANAVPLAGAVASGTLEVSVAAGMRNDPAVLTATGGVSYDFDRDGDGIFDETNTAGTAAADTSGTGIIRPCVRITDGDGGVAYQAVSLIISSNSRPAASAQANPSFGQAPLGVTFIATAEDMDGEIALYAWDFEGDGTYDAIGEVVNHTYALEGTYNVKLRVTDNEGAWDVDTVAVAVGPAANMPPSAVLQAFPVSGDAPLAVTFDASGSSDPDGRIVSFHWDFGGDGGFEVMTRNPVFAHTYDAPGIYNAICLVTDEDGDSNSETIEIEVTAPGNTSPSASLSANPQTGNLPLEVDFDASASTDPDGTIVRYDWDFDGDGVFEAYDAGAAPSWTYSSPGIFDAGVKATDDRGAQDTARIEIDVTVAGNDSPAADIQADPTAGTAPLAVDFDASASGDADGTIVLYEWDFDGNGSYEEYGGNPVNSHTYESYGQFDAKLRVTDDKGAQDTATVQVSVNAAPAAGLSVDRPECQAGEAVRFDATASEDADGSIVNYEWDFDGDGVFSESGDEDDSEGQEIVDRVMPDAGYFTVSVRVTDDAVPAAQDTAGVQVFVHGWRTTTVDGSGALGTYISMAVVDGRPAVACYDFVNQDLVYVRANDAGGSAWGAPVTVSSAGDVGTYASLAVVNGNPAIAYRDATNTDLMYVRANDQTGGTWGAPATVNFTFYINFAEVGNSLAVVNGRPAIAFSINFVLGNEFRFVRANDVNGSSWGSAVSFDATPTFTIKAPVSLAVVNGRPAVAYSKDGRLKYQRANDADGGSWPGFIEPDTEAGVGYYCSLAIIGGFPAISYMDQNDGDLRFVRATDANGGAWDAFRILDSAGTVGQFTSLASIGGSPAVSYFDQTNGNLKFISALDGGGALWEAPESPDSDGTVGAFTSMISLGGTPAIAYFDDTNDALKFARLY
ncbi:MAG: PKD domain-containing protein, partial [bacterium]